MSRLIESIRLNNGEFFNLLYHQARMDRSVMEIFNQANGINLKDHLSRQPYPANGLFKCRIVYSTTIHAVEFLPYRIVPVRSLKIVEGHDIVYSCKFEDRSSLDQLYQLRQDCDDILIVKNGLISDSSYSNILMFDGKQWLTPSAPLLKGTMRQFLLDEGKIKEAVIELSDIHLLKKIKLTNAMLGFNGPELSISQLIF